MRFPENFLWGVANSGFQFEMGDPTGKNVDPNTDWYAWVHDPSNIEKHLVSGDMPEKGVDYWNLYKQDHAIAKKLGLNAFRIGIEWSRIFPNSTSDVEVGVERASDGYVANMDVDESALENLEKIAEKNAVGHYRTVIEDLRANGFSVFVCLSHFTLPLWIHDPVTVRDTRLRAGPKGWVDEDTIIEFTKYAAYIAWKLGDVVDKWATFNEPMMIPEMGYLNPEFGFPPSLNKFRASRKATLNMIIAHARSYDAIKKIDTVKADEDSPNAATVGLTHNVIPAKPLSPQSKSDARATEFMNYTHNHFFIQAICEGWLDENFNGVKEKGELKNYLEQRLDWLGVNYYTRFVVKGRLSVLAKIFAGISAIPEVVKNYGFSCQPNAKSADGLETSDLGWEMYPEGLLESLNDMKVYGKPLYVTENGIADEKDALRASFITEHLKVLERAVNEEKIDVRGYFHWALTDNYEWQRGFGPKFGLCSVDPETKSRKTRKSAETYMKIIREKNET
ncbi:MAG TPA: beta-galactosidase BgaS [Candidatus Bathyarchaeia archaeon]